MKKCITGHVGTPEFAEALRLLEEAYRHWTIFVHDGRSEKAIHFSPTEVLVLNLPSPVTGAAAFEGALGRLVALQKAAEAEGPAGQHEGSSPSRDSSHRKAARDYVTQELTEIESWQGAPFELREGPVPQVLASHDCTLRINIPSAILLDGFRKHESSPSAATASRDSVFSQDPLARVGSLSRCLGSAFAKSIILRELSRAWLELGSPARAAQCLRGVARTCSEWGATDIAAEVLETALELCPPDVGVAEDLLKSYQSAGRQREAESVVERTCSLLERLKLHQEAVALYQRLDRPPESPSLRLLGADAMVHTGQLDQAVRELKSAAAILESRGDHGGAVKTYGKVLEIDPAHTSARERYEQLSRFRALRSLWKTLAALAAAAGLLLFFLFWEMAAASAYGKLKSAPPPGDARQSLDLLKREAGRFPASRYAARIASFEASVYERSYKEDKKTLEYALGAQAAGDLGTARHLLADVARNTIIPAFWARADVAATEISRRQAQWEDLGKRAQKLVEERDFARAFAAYREILQGARRDLFASGYSVPIFIETVPGGVSVEVDGKPAGKTPRWIFVSSDPESVLRLWKQGFEAFELKDPLGAVLATNDCRLRKAMVTPTLARAWEGGGMLTQGPAEPQDAFAVLGADGVLRAVNRDGLSSLWETPLDPEWGVIGAPRREGPAILLATSKGKVMAFSSKTGKPAWVTRVAGEGEPVSLEPSISSQAVVVARGNVILLNPLTGLPHRRLALGNAEAAGPMAAVSGRAYVALRAGGLAVFSLRTGKLESTQPEGNLQAIFSQQDGLVLLTKEGNLRSLALEGRPRRWEVRFGPEYSLACKATENRVCVASPSGSVVCVDSGSGTPVWKLSLEGSLQRLSGGEGQCPWVFAHLLRGGGMALDALAVQDGSLSWETSSENAEDPSVLAAKKDLLISSPTLGILAVKVPGSGS